jgi:hypothetical protein
MFMLLHAAGYGSFEFHSYGYDHPSSGGFTNNKERVREEYIRRMNFIVDDGNSIRAAL